MGYRRDVLHQQRTGAMARRMREDTLATPAADAPSRGDRVRLVFTSDPYTRLKPGDEGTVSFVDSMNTVHVSWESGSGLGLVPGEDCWEVISSR